MTRGLYGFTPVCPQNHIRYLKLLILPTGFGSSGQIQFLNDKENIPMRQLLTAGDK